MGWVAGAGGSFGFKLSCWEKRGLVVGGGGPGYGVSSDGSSSWTLGRGINLGEEK